MKLGQRRITLVRKDMEMRDYTTLHFSSKTQMNVKEHYFYYSNKNNVPLH